MWKYFKLLFSYTTNENIEKSSVKEQNVYDLYLISKVIELLLINPNDFSARWFSKIKLDKSVRSNDGKIQIMIETGQIISPVEPNMNDEQKEKIKSLIEEIVNKDKEYLVHSVI